MRVEFCLKCQRRSNKKNNTNYNVRLERILVLFRSHSVWYHSIRGGEPHWRIWNCIRFQFRSETIHNHLCLFNADVLQLIIDCSYVAPATQKFYVFRFTVVVGFVTFLRSIERLSAIRCLLVKCRTHDRPLTKPTKYDYRIAQLWLTQTQLANGANIRVISRNDCKKENKNKNKTLIFCVCVYISVEIIDVVDYWIARNLFIASKVCWMCKIHDQAVAIFSPHQFYLVNHCILSGW